MQGPSPASAWMLTCAQGGGGLRWHRPGWNRALYVAETRDRMTDVSFPVGSIDIVPGMADRVAQNAVFAGCVRRCGGLPA